MSSRLAALGQALRRSRAEVPGGQRGTAVALALSDTHSRLPSSLLLCGRVWLKARRQLSRMPASETLQGASSQSQPESHTDWPMGLQVPIGSQKQAWTAIGLAIHPSSLAVVLETVETRPPAHKMPDSQPATAFLPHYQRPPLTRPLSPSNHHEVPLSLPCKCSPHPSSISYLP